METLYKESHREWLMKRNPAETPPHAAFWLANAENRHAKSVIACIAAGAAILGN